MNHSFNVQIAEKYGIEEAIIIEHLYFWIHKNECDEVEEMMHEGRIWCRSSAKGMAKYIPYMKPDKIWRILKKLVEKEVIIEGNFNKVGTNQTLWYAFTDNFMAYLNGLRYDFEKIKNGFLKNEKCNNSIINNTLNKENNIKENNKRLSNDNQKEEISFDDFYKIYPVKKSKAPAERKWKTLSQKDRKAAIDRLPRYIADCVECDRSIKHPSTYLNQRTWEDQFIGDDEEQEQSDTIPLEDANVWNRTEKWMQQVTPRIAEKVTYKHFVQMRDMVHKNGSLFAEIMKYIETSGYIGDDIVKEFERVSKLRSSFSIGTTL